MNKFEQQRSKPRFINPPNVFKQKVGSGGISNDILKKSEDYLEKVEVDFGPYASRFLEQFKARIEEAMEEPDHFEAFRNDIVSPVMQLKANGGMFRYDLVSEVADIGMQFLEVIDEINKDSHAVIIAFQNTLQVIITNKLKGDGGKEGYALVKELDKACQRYFDKHRQDS